MKITKILMLVIIAFLTGCVTAPVVEIKPFDKSVSFEGDFDESWGKLVRFLSTNDVNIGTIEKDSGLITLSGDNLSAGLIQEYCDAAAPFMWVLSSGLAKGSVLMTNEDGFITATVNVKFNATSSYTDYMGGSGTKYSTTSCNSRGAFETALLGSLQ